MTRKISYIHTLRRMTTLLSSAICALWGFAQTSLPEKLSHVLEVQDMDLGMRLYQEITEADLKQLPDSSLFDYHYLGGYLNSSAFKYDLQSDVMLNHDKAISHLLKAKDLCDTKLGTYSIGYMEIMRGLGDEYIELGKYENALAMYQEGIVKSMAVRNSGSHAFGNLIMGVQECYENMGWFNEVPNHLMDAWSFWPKDETLLETYTYYPLWCLEQFYRRYGMYDKALSISEEIEKFIISKGGDYHPEMCEALYMKGNILKNTDKQEDAIAEYERAINISKKNKIDDSELLGMLYGNLLMTLASNGEYAKCESLLNEIEIYSKKTHNPTQYANALFSLANSLCEKGKYVSALGYNAQLLKLSLSDEEKQVVERQTNTIKYNQEITESHSLLEERFRSLEIGSAEWFETAHKLSSAYYIFKDWDGNDCVLKNMYEAMLSHPTNGSDYRLWVLMNLYMNCLENEDYSDALRFALEKYEVILSVSDATELHRINAINDVAVAKMKCNNLEGIDSDLAAIESFDLAQFGEISGEYATYLHNRGRAYQLQKKFDEAKETLLKAISIQNKVEGKPFKNTVKYYMEVQQELGEI